MPKDKGRGGKNRRRAKNTSSDVKRELLFKEEGHEYAQVLKMLGGGRVELFCFDGVKRMGTIRGKMIKRVWIQTGDIVLVSLLEFAKDSKKCTIIHKYFPDEAKRLKAHKEIPDNVELAMGGEQETDPNFVFGDESGEEDGDDDDEEEGNARRRDIPESSDEDDDSDDDEERKSRDSIDDI